jgi:hypothetical protein
MTNPREIDAIKDKFGRRIEPGDVLKVFHFIGARGKHYYMYKLVYEHEGYLRCAHLSGNLPKYGMHGFDCRVLSDTDFEIIESGNFEKLEHKDKAALKSIEGE